MQAIEKNLLILVLVCASYAVLAGDEPGLQLEVNSTLTALSANTGQIDNEYFASFDLLATMPTARGHWSLMIEANSTPRDRGITAVWPDINNDVGSALDEQGHGRVQLSSLHFDLLTARGSWAVGLLNAADYLDTSEIANDEKTQFLNSGFVNNPTIAFPDYSLGLAYSSPVTATRPGYALLLSGSHGLANTEGASYSELMRIGEGDKGLFLAAQAQRRFGTVVAGLGAWVSSAHRTSLTEDDHSGELHRGVFAVVDGQNDRANWNLRLGMADTDRSNARYYFGLATEYAIAEDTLGVAIGHSIPGRESGGWACGCGSRLEIYYRYSGLGRVEITPNIQFLHNGHGGQQALDVASNVIVSGVRVNVGL